MKIEISKCDAIHIMNWLNMLKNLCNEPKNGMHYMCKDIQALRERLFEAYKPTFGDKMTMRHDYNDQVSFPTGKDFWWVDKAYMS